MSGDVIRMKIRVGEREIEVKGRPAHLLDRLIASAPKGITTAELPAGLRVSDSVFKLRKLSFPIVTDRVAHKGDFPGQHGCYRLAGAVEVVEVERKP